MLFSFLKAFWTHYSSDILLISIIVFLVILAVVQAKNIKVLREELSKGMSGQHHDEIVALARESLDTNGEIQTIKLVRQKTGMSLVDAKNFVDSLKQPY